MQKNSRNQPKTQLFKSQATQTTCVYFFLGDDKWGYEKASERWLPIHTVETIFVSFISMLADPNDE